MTQKNGAHHLTEFELIPPNTHLHKFHSPKLIPHTETCHFLQTIPKVHTICTRVPQTHHNPQSFSRRRNYTTTTNEKSIPDPSAEGQPEKSKTGEITDLGREIKAAMKEREGQKGESGFLDGVAEEIREIEWPAFDKVLGTTVVVLGVIAGSSVVLLTVNAILAELSDRVFAGRAAQITFERSE